MTPIDLTVGSILGKIAEGLPIALGLAIIIVLGNQGKWLWRRELDASNLMWQKRFDEMQVAAAARLHDCQLSCEEWKSIAKRTLGAAEKIVPVVIQKTTETS